MKKFKTGLLVVALATAMVICVIFIKSLIERQAIMAHSALTVPELDELARKWGVVKNEEFTSSSAITESSVPGGSQGNPDQVREAQSSASHSDSVRLAGNQGSSPVSPEVKRPTLQRTLTKSEKQAIADGRRRLHNGICGSATLRFTESLASMYLTIGFDEGAGFYYFDAARVAYSIGDWETAKQFYREAPNFPLGTIHRQETLVGLAKTEDDPLVADRLLELACPPDESCWAVLYEVTDLAWRTGSGGLYDYYLARLREELPEIASQFDLRPRPKGTFLSKGIK